MRILSAADAVTPAFERTKLVLYSPFRKGRTWKLSVTAYLSFAGTAFMPVTLLYVLPILLFGQQMGRFKYAVIVLTLLLTIVYVVVYILCSRLKFAFFDIVLNRGEFVAPAWRKYKEQSWRWTNVKILVGTVLTLLALGPSIPLIRHIAPAWIVMMKNKPGQPPPPEFFSAMAAFYGFYFLMMFVVGIYIFAMSTVSSFVVPSLALENQTIGEALRRFWAFVKREPGQFFAFVGLRAVFGLLGYMGLIFAYELVLLLLIFIIGGVCGLIALLLHLVGVPNPVLLVFGVGVFGLVLMPANVYLLGLALGPFFIFFEAHTLYFLGGRYPMLGELLERSTPPPAMYVPPPGYYSQQ